MKFAAIILCAGRGVRLKQKEDKAFIKLGPKYLFEYSYDALKNTELFSQFIFVSRKKYFNLIKNVISDKNITFQVGGKRRQDSVYNGLKKLKSNIDYVFIHDGARPFITEKLLKKLAAAVKKKNAVVPAKPVKEALKLVKASYIKEAVDRTKLYAVQTPQVFEKKLILLAYKSFDNKVQAFDDAQVVEEFGYKVSIVKDNEENLKITYPQDLIIARALLGKDNKSRVGLGFDLHKFDLKKKKIVLCGVKIDCGFGLKAVSDGDVALHAICDAILGSACLGDIGDYFPVNSKKSKGISSKKIVEDILGKIKNEFSISNIDLTIVAQKPRLVKHKKKMVESLEKIFKIPVNVKIKSKENTDILGGIDSISCLAVANLKKC